jgi:hypothetical protein
VQPGEAFQVSFVDIHEEALLHASLTSGNETSKKSIIEANGTGVAFVDYDNDGWLDVFLVNGSRFEHVPNEQELTSRLYHNEKNGRFTDVSIAAGVARSGWGGGVCAGDYDNNGFIDLYVTYWGPNSLYRNLGNGRLADVAAASGVAGPPQEWSSGCTWLDYDRDGHLDLFVSSYQQFDPARTPPPGKGAHCDWQGLPVFCGPRGLPFGTVTLFHNRGNATFDDVSQQAGVRMAGGYYAFTSVAVDMDDDGWVDIFVACDSTPNLLFRNNRNGTFSEVALEAGVALDANGLEQGGMGVGVGDFDNDGRLDLVKTNFAFEYSNLYRNIGGGNFADVVLPAGLWVKPLYVGWGVAFTDLDNDGWKDVVQVTGHVYPELDGRQHGMAYRSPRLVFRNLGTGRFEDVSARAGPAIAQLHSSRGAAFGDVDNDGDIDVLVMNMGEPPSLLRNDATSTNHWVSVLLRGTRSNRSAIGASISVYASGFRQTDVVLSQSSFLSQNDFRLHFGLGAATRVDRVSVRWPDGATESFDGGAADRVILLVEGTGRARQSALRGIDVGPRRLRRLPNEVREEPRRPLEAWHRDRVEHVAARVIHRPRVDRLHTRAAERLVAAQIAWHAGAERLVRFMPYRAFARLPQRPSFPHTESVASRQPVKSWIGFPLPAVRSALDRRRDRPALGRNGEEGQLVAQPLEFGERRRQEAALLE